MSKVFKFFVLSLLLLLAVGCGQKGDLYLPEPEAKLTQDTRA
ncbi:LPS translocon maturation chaperone LptM [Marinospirillum minutulum]|nr:lipoprotein [Marinospirillum minutulum]